MLYMTNPGPRNVVERLFAAFAAGDLDALLATVHPDSRWTYIGANPRRTRAELSGHHEVRRFFARILERLDVSAYTPTEWVEQNETIVVFGFEAGTVRRTGETFRNEWTQKYVVRDGLVVEMAEYNVQIEPPEQRSWNRLRSHPTCLHDSIAISRPKIVLEVVADTGERESRHADNAECNDDLHPTLGSALSAGSEEHERIVMTFEKRRLEFGPSLSTHTIAECPGIHVRASPLGERVSRLDRARRKCTFKVLKLRPFRPAVGRTSSGPIAPGVPFPIESLYPRHRIEPGRSPPTVRRSCASIASNASPSRAPSTASLTPGSMTESVQFSRRG